MCSVLCPLLLQLKSCNAALQAAGLGSSSGGVDVRIKWPNDVYAGQLKLGGILCHSSYRDRKFHVIMGVRWAARWLARPPVRSWRHSHGLHDAQLPGGAPMGACRCWRHAQLWAILGCGSCLPCLAHMPSRPTCPGCLASLQLTTNFQLVIQVGLNLANRSPTTCVDALIEQAAAAAAAAGAAAGSEQRQRASIPPVRREDLLAGIVNRLEPMLERLAAEGFAPFEEEYCRHWLHSGQQVGQVRGPGGRQP